MSLTTYHKKRTKNKTTEPFGGEPNGTELRFVVQKHDASHLHYDFRLEMNGVLKSWAVPKGPSLNPEEKRLAVLVEDHPYDYITFEGIIPKGEYGGGTVIVWDEGTYESLDKDADIKTQQKQLISEFKKGKITFILKGKKLKGEFALVKFKNTEADNWLLIKAKDKYAKETDILKKNKSVRSGKTISQLSSPAKQEKTKVKKKEIKDTEKTPEKIENIIPVLEKAGSHVFYKTIKPMLATLVGKPIENKDWIYELKWDGYRAIAFLNKGKVDLKSRNNISFKKDYLPIYNALKTLKINAILDGEIVVMNEQGIADFELLQKWKEQRVYEIYYYVFDLLWYEGKSLMNTELINRRALLKSILPENNFIRFSKNFNTTGTQLLRSVQKMGMEGIVAKRKDSLYREGERSHDWLKIKIDNRQEAVIGGFTITHDSSRPFSALIIGFFKNNQLKYSGKVGTGFNIKQQEEMLELFKKNIVKKTAFKEADVKRNLRNNAETDIYWLSPKLVCEVKYSEITSRGILRHPVFVAMRMDKKAVEVNQEKPIPSKKIIQKENISDKKKSKNIFSGNTKLVEYKIGKQVLSLTNLDKVYWKKEKITKGDLLHYYDEMAEYILPYLKNRPLTLLRHPNGISGQSFYQKDVTNKVADWIKTYQYATEENPEKDKQFFMCDNKASLLYMINLGCIEINPWSSTILKPDKPDWCILDIDPDKQSFEQVIDVAQTIKAILDSLKIDALCKTSGSTGLHIYIPLGAKYTYEQSKQLAHMIASITQQELPKYTTLERMLSQRKGKLYIDYLQNRSQATIASPYCVRPKPGAPVSMPLHWDEVKKGLSMTDFNIFNALERAKSVGDIFKPVLGKGINLRKILSSFK